MAVLAEGMVVAAEGIHVHGRIIWFEWGSVGLLAPLR